MQKHQKRNQRAKKRKVEGRQNRNGDKAGAGKGQVRTLDGYCLEICGANINVGLIEKGSVKEYEEE